MKRNMRIAVISEVFGNFWALESVLKDIRRRGVDRILNLGDSLYGPLAPLETAWRLRTRDVLSVRGQLDRLLAGPTAPCLPLMAAIARSRLDAETRRWLRHLPSSRVFASQIVMCNRCRDAGIECPAPRVAARPRRKRRTRPRAVILCGRGPVFGKKAFPGGTIMIRPGSVGLPARRGINPYSSEAAMGSPHARYALIESGAGGLDVRPIEVEYPWDAAAAAALANGCPDWAVWLRTGRA